MEIDEDDADLVLRALHCAMFEQGEDEDSLRMIERIRKEFPNIDREIKEKERTDHLWAVVAEQDQRVIDARKKLDETPLFLSDDNHRSYDGKTFLRPNPEYLPVQKEFMKIKGQAFKELESA